MHSRRGSTRAAFLAAGVIACGIVAHAESGSGKTAKALSSIVGKGLSISVDADGGYAIQAAHSASPVLRSQVAAEVDARVLRSTEYPQHRITQADFSDEFGAGSTLTVTHTGLAGTPDLVCVLHVYREQTWGDIEVKVANTTSRAVSVRSIRSVETEEAPVVNLGGPANEDRILSDSYSEDRPQLAILDLGSGPGGVHRAIGSQLIYNRQSGQSLFLGALSSDKFLTIFHLAERSSGGTPSIASYDAVATGTTEILRGESLRASPPQEQVTLALVVKPGDSLSSERLMVAAGDDYHAQLEQYGHVIARLHNARVSVPTPIGWWSWTAYYFGLSEATATTNIEWLAQHLKSLGYTYFHIDEGYQYARGEYTTADANLFPRGLSYVAAEARQHGLTFGVWTAPFEVSERADVYQNHKDWLLHNAAGDLIHIGNVTEGKDPLYVLDVTNPGSQAYLRQTYRTLRAWGVGFIKMDFMDDSAAEGAYYRPNTTALEAQRIGLRIIREAVGEDVVLDKDGSPMLNPVGIVDAGRISQDTGHSFDATRDAASGIAARYYMNRTFFVSDPDAFTVSTQTTDDQAWQGGTAPLTLDEAKASIALSAVSGGMYELGDDLPTLGELAERVALVQNQDLLDMARLGRASLPVDLMTYSAPDKQPSEFLLRESPRQTILTIFNWTNEVRTRELSLASLGMQPGHAYELTEVLGNQECCKISRGRIDLRQAPHSVAVLKLIDRAIPRAAPQFSVHAAPTAKSGEPLSFHVESTGGTEPILACRWDFGDGVSSDGMETRHGYTHSGTYEARATVKGLDGTTNSMTFTVSVSGSVATQFMPKRKHRLN